jgi:hypothetical protein
VGSYGTNPKMESSYGPHLWDLFGANPTQNTKSEFLRKFSKYDNKCNSSYFFTSNCCNQASQNLSNVHTAPILRKCSKTTNKLYQFFYSYVDINEDLTSLQPATTPFEVVATLSVQDNNARSR